MGGGAPQAVLAWCGVGDLIGGLGRQGDLIADTRVRAELIHVRGVVDAADLPARPPLAARPRGAPALRERLAAAAPARPRMRQPA